MFREGVLYEEKHSMPKWSWIIIILLIFVFWGIVIVQLGLGIQVGNNAMSDGEAIVAALIFGFLIPAMLLLIRGEVKVTNESVIVSLTPLYRKSFEIKSIKKIEQLEIKPLREFGGWGIRWNGAKWGFIMEGNGGVEIITNQNKIFVVSSKNAPELFRILEEKLIEGKK